MLITERKLANYLKQAVNNWRATRDSLEKRRQFRVSKAECRAYVAAYQSVHVTVFGEKVV